MKPKILLIIGTLSLFSCAINHKTKEKEVTTIDELFLEEKTEILDQYQESNQYVFQSKNDFSQWFDINYIPTFDSYGNANPFVFERTINGQTERIVIEGATIQGKVQDQRTNAQTKVQTQTRTRTIVYAITHRMNKTKTITVTKTKERFSFGPQSIYILSLLVALLVVAILALTGHWAWIKNLLLLIKNKFKR